MFLDISGVCKTCSVMVLIFRHISATGTTRINLSSVPLVQKCPQCHQWRWELVIEQSREVLTDKEMRVD